MEEAKSFDEILDATDKLPLEDQQALLDILGRRIVERRRNSLAQEVRSARSEFRGGRCRPATADEIMKEILS